MRILHVHNSVDAGGVNELLRDIRPRLHDLGHETELALWCTQGNGIAWAERWLNEFKPDIVFIHNLADADIIRHFYVKRPTVRKIHDHHTTCIRVSRVLRGTPCARKLGIGCIAQGCIFSRPRPGFVFPQLNSLRNTKAELDSTRLVDAVIVDSQFMRDLLVRHEFPPRLIHVLPDHTVIPQESEIVRGEEGHVLFVGRLHRHKGVAVLIQALAQVHVPWRLTVIGDGEERANLERLVSRLALQEHVTFVGWLPRAQIDEYYRQAAFVVVPSLWPEPFGRVGIEAMAHARATVAFDVGGIRDWLSHKATGLLVQNLSANDLAKAISTLLQDVDNSVRMGLQGREIAQAQFDIVEYPGKLIQVFEQAQQAFTERQNQVSPLMS